MTHDRDIERLLDHWFTDGPEQASDRVLDVVVDRVGRQRQRPTWRLDWRLPTMTPTFKFGVAVVAVGIVVIIGFGLLRGPLANVGAPVASPSPSVIPASPSATAGAVVPRACDLMTAAELGAALRLSATAVPDPNIDGSNWDTDYCIYRAGGAEVLGTSYRKQGGEQVFEAWKTQSGTVAVPGLGDQAVWDPNQATLFILKGSRMVSISAGEGSTPLTLEAAKAAGAIIVGRM